jgi:HIRAN domain
MAGDRDDADDVALPFEFDVAGTGYEGRYSIIRRRGAKRAQVRLIPEPTNRFDKSAIAVLMMWTTLNGTEIWEQIGYVPARVSQTVNVLLGSGEWAIEEAFVRRIQAPPDMDAPRVVVRLEGKDLRGEKT